ncbi:PepSY-associated TM helix domain-containing protein [Pseudoxanthomonas sp.]|uniref:PepSY-associated TM helix domain-containing protein n=1 Tax=Pseudoxanthomonas sp. TaxID=1871049 RepID=UPI00258AB9AA|nr:PepSY-associated TM helix domain-containing protein [Pseudoxanthomonas sp.]MCR6687753.1 PepSY domain-containing protein [Pseudoxanthomonas sp.]
MKAATLRIFLSVHTWVGLAAGMLLFIAFYAGALSVFVHELQDWERAGKPVAAATADPQALVDAVFAAHPGAAHGLYLVLPGEHGPVPQAYWFDEATGVQRRFALGDGGALEERAPRAGFVDFIYDLHFTAGLPRTFGTYLFGVVCILYGLALVSGVVLYAPVFLKDLFALRIGRNLKRMWQDAHNVVGVLSLPFHVIFAWSGAVLTIGFVLLAPFQFLVYDGKLLKLLEADFDIAPHVEPAGTPAPVLPVAELLRRGQLALPGLEVESVLFHDAGDANGTATLYGGLPQRRLNQLGGVALNAGSGELVNALGPKDYPPGMAFLRGLQALHYGNFGQAAVKWLYFVLGLAGAFLFYSGNLLWIEARRKRRQLQQPRRTRLVAALTLGVCLGSVAGISALFLADKLLPQAWLRASYFVVFFAAIGWACVRRPARAGHELLWLCAVLTALVPAAAWIGTGAPPWAGLAHGDATRLVVDAFALVLAWAYWRMARATLRRGREGDPNSIWALPAREG